MVSTEKSKSNSNLSMERRESTRFELPIEVLLSPDQPERVQGNLCLGGCDFSSTQAFYIGQRINLVLQLLGMGTSLLVSGEVHRISPGQQDRRVVVLLNDLDFESQRRIARWLDMLSGALPLDSDTPAEPHRN